MRLSFLPPAPWQRLSRLPGLTAMTVSTLAFGIAVWLTTHTIAWTFRNDPLAHVEGLWRVELVRHTEIREALRGTDMSFIAEMPTFLLSPGEVRELSASGLQQSAAAVTSSELPFVVPGSGPAQLGWTQFADRDAFSLFRIPLLAGRVFEDGRRELLVSAELAQRWFGGATQAVGRPLVVAGEEWRIAGVIANGAALGRHLHLAERPDEPDLWVGFEHVTRLGALPIHRHATRGGELALASLWMELRDPDAFREWLGRWSAAHPLAGVPRIRRYQEWSGALRGAVPVYGIFDLLGTVTLAACCLTLARLFRTRGRLQAQELALRRALGESQVAVLGSVLAEAAALSLGAVVLGLLVAAGALHLHSDTVGFQRGSLELPVSRAVLGAAIGLAAGIAAAIFPAWRACNEPPAEALRSGT